MPKYDAKRNGYHFAQGLISGEEIFNFYRTQGASTPEEVLRLAYKRYYGGSPTREQVDTALARYKKSFDLPCSVVSVYVHVARPDLVALVTAAL